MFGNQRCATWSGQRDGQRPATRTEPTAKTKTGECPGTYLHGSLDGHFFPGRDSPGLDNLAQTMRSVSGFISAAYRTSTPQRPYNAGGGPKHAPMLRYQSKTMTRLSHTTIPTKKLGIPSALPEINW